MFGKLRWLLWDACALIALTSFLATVAMWSALLSRYY
jgi:hypothetical protein